MIMGELDIIQIGIGILVLVLICGAAVFALWQSINQKYPTVTYDVYDRGVKQRRVYRLWGDTVVENNIFKLLVNDFTIMGDHKQMEFDMVDSVGFFGFGGGLKRVYRAYRRYDYLFAVKKTNFIELPATDAKGNPVLNPEGKQQTITYETTKIQPQIVVESFDGKALDKIKVRLSPLGILVPLEIHKVNEALQEFEVTNGKAIASRFIDNQKSNKLYLEATNPLVNTLLYSLPLIAITLVNGVVLYLISTTVLSKMVEITSLLQKLK